MSHIYKNSSANQREQTGVKKIITVTVFVLLCTANVFADDESTLRQTLSYLNNIKEIEWVAYEKTNVYLGFFFLKRNYKMIASGAAIMGSKAVGRRVHVWVVPASETSWITGDAGKAYCCATARGGKVESPCN